MESKRENLPVSTFDTWMLETFPTVKSYIDHMMKHFYSSPGIFEEDFFTCASDPNIAKYFSAGVANQLFCVHTKLLAKGRLKPGDPFKVLELGGGNGNMCLLMLQMIEQRALKEKEWATLWNALHYTMLEYSPGLVQAQKERNQRYVTSGKVRVIHGDALHISDSIKETDFALVLSNELIDMLQPHRITMEQDGSIKVNLVLPYISDEKLEKIVSKKEIAELKKQSEQYKEMLRNNITKKQLELIQPCLQKNQIVLSENSFVKLRGLIPAGKYKSQFKFHEVGFVAIKSVPEVDAFLEKEFIERMQPEKTYNVEVGMDPFLQEAKKVTIEDGEVIAIDYFQTADEVDHRCRIYHKMRASFDIYAHPGEADITHDPNVTTLVNKANEAGLPCGYYHLQDTFPVDFPPEVLSHEDKIRYAESMRKGFKNYRVVVLINTKNKEVVLDKNRFTGESQPVTYADLAKLPSLCNINETTGEVTIHLTETDENTIDSYLFDAKKALVDLVLSQKDRAYEMAVVSNRGLQKMKEREVLSHAEKEILLLSFLHFRLSKYPAETDIIALHLKKLTGIDWKLTGIESDIKAIIAYVILEGPKVKMISSIEKSLQKIGLEIEVLAHRAVPNNVLLRINVIPSHTPWKIIYSKKPTLAGNIHSPVTAKGDAHAHLIKAVLAKITKPHEPMFKFFLDALREKNYARALRRICTAKDESDLVYKVTQEFLVKCKELNIKFDINEEAGTEKCSALYFAKRNNNEKLCALLISHGAKSSPKLRV